MDEVTHESMKGWVEEWKIRGAFLDKVHRYEIKNADTQRAFRAFSGMCQYYIDRQPKRISSGLEEFYRKLGHDRAVSSAETSLNVPR